MDAHQTGVALAEPRSRGGPDRRGTREDDDPHQDDEGNERQRSPPPTAHVHVTPPPPGGRRVCHSASITASVCPVSTTWPALMGRLLTVPSRVATMWFSIFMASRMHTTSPAATACPSSTMTWRIVPCIGAEMTSPAWCEWLALAPAAGGAGGPFAAGSK